MLRVLVTVRPRMYREVVALSVGKNRPGTDVRISPPEATAGEIARFRPHLLVCDDTASVPGEGPWVVPCRFEVAYSGSMDAKHARLVADGQTSEFDDASVGDLLRAVDRAYQLLAGQEAASG